MLIVMLSHGLLIINQAIILEQRAAVERVNLPDGTGNEPLDIVEAFPTRIRLQL